MTTLETYHLPAATEMTRVMKGSHLARRLLLLAVALLAGCASTTIDGSWIRPGTAGRPIEGPVLVVGIARDETVRRIYEDDMAAKLAVRGIRATPSYLAVPGMLDGDSPARLLREARQAGSRYLLSTVVIGQEIEQVAYPDPWGYPGFVGYRGWYGAYWGAAWPAYAQVQTYRVVIAQTSLVRTADDEVDWTVRTRTAAQRGIEAEVRSFVDVIVGAMARDGLVAAGK